ncbi:DegT/DnrJ/EryC1/StrS family aminotransferase [Candidatus Babeliales bacterium]|nr:DegT/DnrJ/EryC1/StrS family aminotransferase [Candidatus Babeliales bacterium]
MKDLMDTIKTIPITGPSITQKEIDAVCEAVTHGWYENATLNHRAFEQAFKEYIGVKHALFLSSCTAATHLALIALGVQPGDEIILPDSTWTACAEPIVWLGATPVFVDIDPHTWCISPQAIEAAITSKTRVIMPVDLYGNIPDMEAIRSIATRHNLPILEDAAEAIGSEFNGQKAGSFGDISVFSFHPTKTITTGEGGMLVTNSDLYYNTAVELHDHGRAPTDKSFQANRIGYKYKATGMQAALGLAQLKRIDELVNKKRQIFSWYETALQNVPGIHLNPSSPGLKNSYWLTTFILDPSLNTSKETFIQKMKDKKITCRPFFNPLSSMPAYQRFLPFGVNFKKKNKYAYAIGSLGINLPSGTTLTKSDVNYVCNAIQEYLGELT